MAEQANPSEPKLAEGWHAIVVGAGVLALAELGRGRLGVGATAFAGLGRTGCLFAVILASLFVAVLHHGLGWTLLASGLARPRTRRFVRTTSMVVAALYGWLLQASITHGDGLAASAWGGIVRVGLGVLAPVGLAALVGFLFWPGYVPARARSVALLALLLSSLAISLFVLPQYRLFHGLLGGIELCVAALLVVGRRATRTVALAFAALGLLGTIVLAPRAFAAQAYVRRLTRIPGAMLEALPATNAMLPSVEPFVDPDARPEIAPLRLESVTQPALKARGNSVLLLVLEATRADVWADPGVAPEFARWKSHGLYVPRAVSQYPATPLAYGALFTSHPPSVVAQSPHWSHDRLFDLLRPKFQRLLLTEPKDAWFDSGAMTSFITSSAPISRHASTHEAVTALRELLGHGDGPFFAWAHLYDPHEPYEARGGLSPKAPRGERYRSEVKALDAELGAFMSWFYEQPFAKNTLVILVGDHGEGLGELVGGEPYVGHHVHVADPVSHVPFYASGPGVPAGVTRTDLGICQLDVMPTIFDHLGESIPPRFFAQGRALPALLEDHAERALPTEAFSIRGREFFDFVKSAGRSDASTQRRFFHRMWESGTYPPKLAIEKGHLKLVRDTSLGDDALYDLASDPRERTNIAASHPAELAAMRRALDDWIARQVGVLKALESSR